MALTRLRGKLVVRNGLAILDIDLAKDLVVAIDDDAGRFHLLELAQIERRCLPIEISGSEEKITSSTDQEDERNPH